ncbi:MAG: NAD(P)-dependent alcohol dehydrogenase [Clostridiaceae bacterium]|nr:NAD(P)-dependent alcohol dehydrogenase [Clostridiaceae bacterium]
MPKKTMKAAICEKYGSASVLCLTELPVPVITNSELLIKIEATTVTSGDVRMRSSDFPPLYYIPGRLVLGLVKPKKQILGHEFAGTVSACGNGVKRFKVGDRVYGTTSGLRTGSYAEFIAVPEKKKTCVLGRMPEKISFAEAAAVPIGGMAALDLLSKGNLDQAGQHVMIIGACGSVGSFALQIARIFDACVTAVCSSSKIEIAKTLGADQIIDYRTESISSARIKYDLIFDSTGKYKKSELLPILAKNGRFVSTKSLTAEKNDYLYQLTEWLEQGKIKPLIDRCFTLNNIKEAHQYVESGHKSGGVIIAISAKEIEKWNEQKSY